MADRHGRLHHKCNRLQLLATCSITITNKQNHNEIDYDYIESNHDYNRNYIRLETSSEQKQTPLAWFDVSMSTEYHDYNRNYNQRSITITIAITFVLKHLQNKNKTHFHGLM